MSRKEHSAKHYSLISKAISHISTRMHDQPSLQGVADALGLSEFHVQRLFAEWAGVSPKKFLQYLSIGHAKRLLKREGLSVLDAAYRTGLSGSGRLHDLFVTIEGMTPGEYQQGGKGLTILYSINESPFGQYLVASTDKGICSVLFFEGDPAVAENELRLEWPNANISKRKVILHEQVAKFFSGIGTEIIQENKKIRLHLKGTPFQLKVWEALLKIPEGRLASYADISASVERPGAHRAVGTAIGSNPVGFIIPCHRVIRSVGGIGEYRWGSERKMAMIGLESAKHDVDKHEDEQ